VGSIDQAKEEIGLKEQEVARKKRKRNKIKN